MAANPSIGFIGFGELGECLAVGLRGAGVAQLLALDLLESPVKRGWVLDRVARTGVELLPEPAGLVRCDVVLACVPPGAALDAAHRCAPWLRPDAPYVDLASVDGDTKRALAGVVGGAGRLFAGGAVTGVPAESLHRVPMLVSGPGAERAIALLAPLGMRLDPCGADPGAAAAIKILRSLLAKGLEALYVEALGAARREGLAERVLDSFCAFLDARPARETARLLVCSHVVHAARRADEMNLCAAALERAGRSPVLARAVAAVMERSAAGGVRERLGARPPATLEEALEVLAAAGAAP
ncbi:DUF1932 domain-containing protein [Pseudothauera rhizosphaerae]|nr:DUF1932 domain-containing protein [Pseudothauera rhizosphaerae]